MIKRQLYGKTARYGTDDVILTEKIDGSNLGLFNLNGKLLVAQRNNIFVYPDERDEITYGKLPEWLDRYGDILLNNLHPGSGFFGEWIGENKGEYPFTQDFMVFAKATIDEKYKISHLNYNIPTFIYPFLDQVIPEFVGVVPIVLEAKVYPMPDDLDRFYDDYVLEVGGRKVEGFVINYNNSIRKYVRFKGNRKTPHKP